MRQQHNWVWVALGFALAGSLTAGLLGCLGVLVLILPERPEHAEKYLSQVQVHPEYQYLDEGSEGNCNCNLERRYVGPSHIEPDRVFFGPELSLRPTDGSLGYWDQLLEGAGASEASGECRIVVSRYQESAPQNGWELQKLSTNQRALVASGHLAVLGLYAMCDHDVS